MKDFDGTLSLMRTSLQQGMSAATGQTLRIRDLYSESFTGSSSFAVDRLRAVLDDGRTISVFFKDLNPMHQLAEARHIREHSLDRSRRELWMYQEILDSERMGTPRLYGSHWEPERDLMWLFIEDVGPKRLSRVGDFEMWVSAARWLAALHASFNVRAVEDNGILLRYDDTRYSKAADFLRWTPMDVTPAQHATIRRALDAYDEIDDSLSDQPWGLIHGEYFGKNVVLRPDEPRRPIAVIDWETAGYGPLYRDLTDISAGRWTTEQRLAMWRAYYDQYRSDTGSVESWAEFRRQVRSIELCQAIAWLSWWSRGDRQHIDRWIREIDRIVTEQGREGE